MFASVIFLILGYQRADIDITFHITTAGNLTKVSGRDGSGVIYGCRELIDRLNDSEGKLNFPEELKDGPEMVLRGAYVGLQKMTYLPAVFPATDWSWEKTAKSYGETPERTALRR